MTKVRSSSNFSKNIALKVAKKVKSLHVSIIKEVFYDISLEIVNLSTMMNAFDHFFKPEYLTKKNSYKCEKC